MLSLYLRRYRQAVLRGGRGVVLCQLPHTPWYHEMLLGSAVISPGTEVTAHIRVHNFGAPANFKIAGTLYQTTTPDLSSVTDGESWWVERTGQAFTAPTSSAGR